MTSLGASLLLSLVPRRERDALAGDLAEEGLEPGTWRFAAAICGVASRHHAEPWRDERERLGALLTLGMGAALWWAVTAAGAAPAEGFVELYRDPVSRAALRFWAAAHFPAAIAVGLLAGHAPWLRASLSTARAHVVVVLAVGAALAAPAGAGWAVALVLIAAAWAGARARPAGPLATRARVEAPNAGGCEAE